MWGYAALPASLAVVWYNNPAWWLVLGLLACMGVYHLIYKRLAALRKRDARSAQRILKGKHIPTFTSTQPAPLSP